MSDLIKPFYRTPCCKPLRFLELIVIIICFTLLFFLRRFSPEDEVICSSTALIVLFTTVGSSLLITIIDVGSQVWREPVPNSPMVLGLLLGFINCLIAGVTALLIHDKYEHSKSHRNLNTLCLLAGNCFLASLLYILDALIVIRYTC